MRTPPNAADGVDDLGAGATVYLKVVISVNVISTCWCYDSSWIEMWRMSGAYDPTLGYIIQSCPASAGHHALMAVEAMLATASPAESEWPASWDPACSDRARSRDAIAGGLATAHRDSSKSPPLAESPRVRCCRSVQF